MDQRLRTCRSTDFIRTTEQLTIKESFGPGSSGTGCSRRRRHLSVDTYAGWYSVRDEAYYAEEETTFSATTSVRRRPAGHAGRMGRRRRAISSSLSAYQDRPVARLLRERSRISSCPDSRRNEVISFVKGGLKDLSISRTTFDWGVKVPDDPEHVMYVWVDALTNYITGVGFPERGNADNWPTTGRRIVHIIGKDIIRFHAVYWPAFLMSAGHSRCQKRVYAPRLPVQQGREDVEVGRQR